MYGKTATCIGNSGPQCLGEANDLLNPSKAPYPNRSTRF